MPRASKIPAGKVTALLGLLSLAVAVLALRNPAVEQWLIWRLGSKERARWTAAAERLLGGGSVRALPQIVAAALEKDTAGFDSWEEKLFQRYDSKVVWALPGYRMGLRHEIPEVRRKALNALRRARWRRPEVVPVLIEALESADPIVRWQCAYVLAELGPGAHAAVPALIRALRDPSEDVRWASVVALGSMASATDEPIEALSRRLADPSALVACHAARALAGFGPRAEPALPALIAALKGKDPLRGEAARALGAIGGGAREAVPVLVQALEGGPPWPSEEWAYHFTSYNNDMESILEDEIPASVDHDLFPPTDGRCHAVRALLELGADPRELAPLLKTLLQARGSESFTLRQEAAYMLARAPELALQSIPELIDTLGAGEHHGVFEPFLVNHAAVEVLARIGAPAIPALVEAMDAANARMRKGAALALGIMDPVSEAALEALRTAAREKEHPARLEVLLALRLADPDFNAVPLLLDCLARKNTRSEEDLGGTAVAIMRLLGREATPSLPAVVEWLQSGDRDRACAAAHILGAMAKEVPEALALVLPGLETELPPRARTPLVLALADATHSQELVFPAFSNVLTKNEADEIWLMAVSGLCKFGRKAVPVLKNLLAWELPARREGEVYSILASVAPDDPLVLERLGRSLESGKNASEVFSILGKMLDADRVPVEAIPLLRRAFEDGDLCLRVRAARLLWRVERQEDKILPLLEGALRDHWHTGEHRSPWGPAFFLGREGVANRVRQEAARTLAEMGPAARPLVPELRASLGYPDRVLRVLLAEALWKVAGELRLEVLLDALGDQEYGPPIWLFGADGWPMLEPQILEAIRVLGTIGPRAREAVPALEKLLAYPALKSERGKVREALRRIKGE